MVVGYSQVGAFEHVRLQIIGTTGVIVNGQHASAGDIVDCPAGDALFLIGRGIAKRYTFPSHLLDPPAAPDPVIAEEGDEEVEEAVADAAAADDSTTKPRAVRKRK